MHLPLRLTGCATNYGKSPANTTLCALCDTTVAGADNFVNSTGVCTPRRVCASPFVPSAANLTATRDRLCGER